MKDIIHDIFLTVYHLEHKIIGASYDGNSYDSSDIPTDTLEVFAEACQYLVKIKKLDNKKLNEIVNLAFISDEIPESEYLSFLERVTTQLEAEGVEKTIKTIQETIKPLTAKEIPITKIPGFYALAENYAFNVLQKRLTTKISDPAQLDLYGNGRVESEEFKLFIRGYDELANGINTSACKLLDSLLITATARGLNDTLVKLPLKEYMQMRDLKNDKEVRKQVKRDIDALERVRFEYKGIGKQRGNWLNITLAGGKSGIINSVIVFQFSDAFFNSLKLHNGKYLFMFFPVEALRVNDNSNPYSYALARKITEHKRQNIGKSNENTVSVKSLINSCATLPSYEDVMAGNRNISLRIIEPFERDMDALYEIFQWHYISGQPTTYDEFIESSISVNWLNYPSTGKLVKARKEEQKLTSHKKVVSRKIVALEKQLREIEKNMTDL